MRRPLSRLRAWADLVRPGNAALAVAGVVLGGYLAAGGQAFAGASAGRLALAALSATLVGAGANALNDRLDVATDRINRPERPIPSGRVREGEATALWAGLSALAVALGAAVSPWHGAVAAGSVAVLAAYSRWLKGTPLVGNVVVALVVAFALVYGGAAVGGGGLVWLGAAFALAVNLARELVKDVEDVAGDRAANLATAPVRWGVRPVAGLAAALVVLVLAVLPLPVLTGTVPSAFLLGALGAAGALAASLGALLPLSAPDARRASRWLKASMLLGMAALALA